MNILHLEASDGWGGQEIRILKEAEGLRARGYNIILVVTKAGGLVQKARDQGFLVYEVSFRKLFWPITLFKLFFIMQRHKIDLVNTHSSLDSWIGGIAARIAKKSIIRTRHLSTPIKPGFNSRFVYGTLADFVVTTCASILPMITEQSGKCPSKCISIATGVDPSKIQVTLEEIKSFRKNLAILPDDFLVGTACFMRSWKGIDDLLKAADLLKEVPKLKWVIIGGGHSEKHKRFAEKLKLTNVFFTGHLDPPFPALAALDLFALLSTAHEGVSQAILQAAYLEKPLIATSTGGLNEVCIDKVTGYQVSPFSPEEVAKAVLSMKESPHIREQFGKSAKKLVLEKFTLTHTLDQMEKVYSQIKI